MSTLDRVAEVSASKDAKRDEHGELEQSPGKRDVRTANSYADAGEDQERSEEGTSQYTSPVNGFARTVVFHTKRRANKRRNSEDAERGHDLKLSQSDGTLDGRIRETPPSGKRRRRSGKVHQEDMGDMFDVPNDTDQESTTSRMPESPSNGPEASSVGSIVGSMPSYTSYQEEDRQIGEDAEDKASGVDVPLPAHPLDYIDSDDEDVSTLLQQYEDGGLGPGMVEVEDDEEDYGSVTLAPTAGATNDSTGHLDYCASVASLQRNGKPKRCATHDKSDPSLAPRRIAAMQPGPSAGPLDSCVTRSVSPSDGKAHSDVPEESEGGEKAAQASSAKKKRSTDSSGLPEEPSLKRRKTKASASNGRGSSKPVEELVRNRGQFTTEEIKTVYAFRERYCHDHQISEREFAERVHGNAHNNMPLHRFWTEVYEVLPHRQNRQAVQKFCRRQFHNFAKRGVWTKEDDELLQAAVAQKGKHNWKAVGEMCERFHEDCRDRWRNYMNHGGARKKLSWSQAEEQSLRRAVGECMYLTHQAKLEEAGFPDDEDFELDETETEKLIVWQAVSDRMDGTRSRLQCSTKWHSLRQALKVSASQELRFAEKRVEKGEDISGHVDLKLLAGRVERNESSKRMLPGDYYDMVEALREAGAATEEAVNWHNLGRGQDWRKRWKATDLRRAWADLKEKVLGDRNARPGEGYFKAVQRIQTWLVEEMADRLEERWDPEAKTMAPPESSESEGNHPGANRKTKDERQAGSEGTRESETVHAKAKRKQVEERKARGKNGRKALSDEYVVDSDDGGDDRDEEVEVVDGVGPTATDESGVSEEDSQDDDEEEEEEEDNDGEEGEEER